MPFARIASSRTADPGQNSEVDTHKNRQVVDPNAGDFFRFLWQIPQSEEKHKRGLKRTAGAPIAPVCAAYIFLLLRCSFFQ